MRDPDRLQWDEQWGSYVWGLESAKWPQHIAGVMYIELRKKIPRTPDTTFKGTRVSCNKSIDTTPDKWLETVAQVSDWKGNLRDLEQEIRRTHDSDYVNMLDTLLEKEEQGKGYVRVTWVRRSLEEVTEIGKRIYHEYLDMRNPSHICPTPTWDCKWRCDFREVCLAMSDGADVQEYLYGTGDYKKRDGYYGDDRDYDL
jgi:hypothetical protein